jgi:hypothetical protein
VIGPKPPFSMKMVNGSLVNALWVDRLRLPHILEGMGPVCGTAQTV